MTANCRVKFNPLVSKDGLPLSLDQVLKSVVNPKASLKNAPAVRQFYFDGTDVYLLAFLETGGPVFTVKSIRSVVSNHKILSDYAYKKISGDEVKRFRKTYPEMKFFEIERAVQNEFNVYRDTRVVNNLEIKDNYRSSDFSLDTQVPFFKTVVELDKSDKPFVFLDIPLPAILHAIRMRVKSDQAQAISAGEDSDGIVAVLPFDFSPEGVAALQDRFQKRIGEFSQYDPLHIVAAFAPSPKPKG